MRRLVINADDFGLTAGVNRAIVEANRSGIVTSATVMAGAHAFQEAANLARELPGLKTGCHVVLVDGEPLSADVPTLTKGSRRFRSGLKEFARAAVGKRIAPEEIQREAEAQIRKVQSSGLTVTHVDTHKHTHMFPQVLLPVLRAAKACGVSAVRNPFEPLRLLLPNALRPGLWLRSAEVAALHIFAAAFQRAVREEGMLTTDGTVGIAATGKLDQKMLLAVLKALPEGTWELVCHPGYVDADLQAAGTRLLRSRAIELEALTSVETKAALARQRIEAISYAGLMPSVSAAKAAST